MAYCGKCGTAVSGDDAFCRKCGVPIASTLAQPMAPISHMAPTQDLTHNAGSGPKKIDVNNLTGSQIVVIGALFLALIMGIPWLLADPKAIEARQKAESAERYKQEQEAEQQQKAEAEDRVQFSAYSLAQEGIKLQLKAPSTASFPARWEPGVSIEKNGNIYKIYSHVDAENSFGAKLRQKWIAKVEYLPASSDVKLIYAELK